MKYDAKVIVKFLDQYTEVDPDTRQRWLNGVLMDRKDVNSVYRWRTTTSTVTLDDIDAFLIRHDFMLWELESWADDHGLAWEVKAPARTRRLDGNTASSNSTRP